MTAPTPEWRPWQGTGLPTDVMYTYEWVDDIGDLPDVVEKAGWLTADQARERCSLGDLRVGWYGYRPDSSMPEACTVDGEILAETDEYVELTLKMTWIAVRRRADSGSRGQA